jgi:hypothetical protein
MTWLLPINQALERSIWYRNSGNYIDYKRIKVQGLCDGVHTGDWKVAPEVKKRLDDIRNCRVPDTHGWMYKI